MSDMTCPGLFKQRTAEVGTWVLVSSWEGSITQKHFLSEFSSCSHPVPSAPIMGVYLSLQYQEMTVSQISVRNLLCFFKEHLLQGCFLYSKDKGSSLGQQRVTPLSTGSVLALLLDHHKAPIIRSSIKQWGGCFSLKPSAKGMLEQSNTCPQLLSEST